MGLDTPIKIDLNDGIDTTEQTSLGLSTEQLKSFNEFLDKKQLKEKLGVISLSQKELQNLKTTLETTNTDIQQKIQDFYTKLKEIGEKHQINIEKLKKTGISTGVIDQLTENKEKVSKALNQLLSDSHPSVIEFFKNNDFIGKFIRKILEMFDIDLDTAFNKSVVNKIKERFTKQIQDNEFNDLIIEKNSLDDSFYENLDNDKLGGLTSIKKIAELQGQKVYSKRFLLNLFNKDGLLKGKNILINGKLDYKTFTQSLDEYIQTEEQKIKAQEEKDKQTK